MRSPRNRQTKNMNIQNPAGEVPGRRKAAPTAIAPAKQQERKRHCNGSCHQSIEKRRHDARRRVCWRAPEIEYQTAPKAKTIVVTSTIVQKMTSGLACASFSGAISA